ncbi:hypothetical protein [Lysinibacillus endophyticus]|uniref:hypothetical protein n=1 Tax=Ureibacillus endophyticus TaxID=1978490 RepID=UPI003136AB9C
MGIVLFCITLVLECGYAIYCIATKQHHKKIKNWLRIAVLIVFLILIVSPIITWSFRWVLVTTVFTISAGLATISLIRKKQIQRNLEILESFSIQSLQHLSSFWLLHLPPFSHNIISPK